MSKVYFISFFFVFSFSRLQMFLDHYLRYFIRIVIALLCSVYSISTLSLVICDIPSIAYEKSVFFSDFENQDCFTKLFQSQIFFLCKLGSHFQILIPYVTVHTHTHTHTHIFGFLISFKLTIFNLEFLLPLLSNITPKSLYPYITIFQPKNTFLN